MINQLISGIKETRKNNIDVIEGMLLRKLYSMDLQMIEDLDISAYDRCGEEWYVIEGVKVVDGAIEVVCDYNEETSLLEVFEDDENAFSELCDYIMNKLKGKIALNRITNLKNMSEDVKKYYIDKAIEFMKSNDLVEMSCTHILIKECNEGGYPTSRMVKLKDDELVVITDAEVLGMSIERVFDCDLNAFEQIIETILKYEGGDTNEGTN